MLLLQQFILSISLLFALGVIAKFSFPVLQEKLKERRKELLQNRLSLQRALPLGYIPILRILT